MSKLTIVVHITVQDDKIKFIQEELKKLVDLTRTETGCLQYEVYQDNDKPNHFMFYENWETRELWQIHMDATHLKDYRAATSGMITEVRLYEMTCIY